MYHERQWPDVVQPDTRALGAKTRHQGMPGGTMLRVREYEISENEILRKEDGHYHGKKKGKK